MPNRLGVGSFFAAAFLSLLVSATARVAHAQGLTGSVLTGTVIDAATNQPVDNVAVTATSPSLQGEQIVVTDSTGTYRIPQLPLGTYQLRAEKESYKPYVRGDIQVRADVTLRVNIELLPETILGESILVVGRAPTVDVGSSTISTAVTSDFVRNLALSPPRGRGGAQRSFESLALVAPETHQDVFGISIAGTTSPENSYLIDGVNVNNPAYGINGSPVTSEFISEVEVINGGYMPEYGRTTGGVLNAVTKSGSNEFHGSAWLYFTPGAFEGSAKEVFANGAATSTTSRLWNSADFGATLGGPIIKDRLWFFVGIAPNVQRFQIEKNYSTIRLDAQNNPITDGSSFILRDRIPGARQLVFADQRGLQYIGKLTFLANDNNRLSLEVLGTPTTSGGNGKLPFDYQSGLPPNPLLFNGGPLYASISDNSAVERTNSIDVVLKWQSSFLDKRLLLDATAGFHRQTFSISPGDDSAWPGSSGAAGDPQVFWTRNLANNPLGPHSIAELEPFVPGLLAACGTPNTLRGDLTCPAYGNYATGGYGFLQRATMNSWQGNLKLTYLVQALGHHVIKTGADVQYFDYDHMVGYSGGLVLQESNDGSRFFEFRGLGYLTGPGQWVDLPSIENKVRSVIAGAYIQDSWSILDVVTLNAGVRYDGQSLYGKDGSPGVNFGNEWSPRIGLVYDFTREGKSRLFASYARFYENIPLDAMDREFPGQPGFFDAAGRNSPACYPLPGRSTAGCFDSRNLNPNFNPRLVDPHVVYAGDRTPVDPNITASNGDEVVAGAEYEIVSRGRLGATFTRRYLNRWVEDLSRDEGNTFILANPGYGAASDFHKAIRNYTAVTFYFTKAFSELWLAQLSYTYTSLKGNLSGLYRHDTGQLDPNISSDFDLRSLLINRIGPLPGDGSQIKLHLAKQFFITGRQSLVVGGNFTTRQGDPITYTGLHPLYGPGEIYLLPRGSAGRTPWISSVDLRLAYSLNFDNDRALTVSLDIFNLLNFQRATRVDQNYTFSAINPLLNGSPADLANTGAVPNPNFKYPTAYQPPRDIRLGARFTF